EGGAPALPLAPVRARARTNELDAGERWPMIAGEESPLGCGLPGTGGGWLPGGGARVRRGGLTSTHSAARLGGDHDHVFRGPGYGFRGPGDSVRTSDTGRSPAQDVLRAHPGPCDPSGAVTAPLSGAWRVAGLRRARRR